MTPPPVSIFKSRLIFVIAATVLLLLTWIVIPWLSETIGIETIVAWFICAGLGVFLPLLIAAWLFLKREGGIGRRTWTERLRFRRMNSGDWAWAVGGIGVIGFLTIVIMRLIEGTVGYIDPQPPFMRFDPLGPGRYWILQAWFPFWLLNIMGEEIFWRGVLLPRMEIGIGRSAWLHQTYGWGLFHFAFGWQLVLTLLPILFILPFIVQRRGNSWIGVIIHAVLNGPAFILLAPGYL